MDLMIIWLLIKPSSVMLKHHVAGVSDVLTILFFTIVLLTTLNDFLIEQQ